VTELGNPVIIVSAFGRGHWLAQALVSEGIKTTLIDVTAQLGAWPSEDSEGPFGFFRTEGISESQIERLYSDDHFDEVSNGFTIWLDQGPFECKGPLTRYRTEQLKLAPQVNDVLLGTADLKSAKLLYKNIGSIDFSRSWLLHLSHQWAGTTYEPNAKAAEAGMSLPMFSPFLVRGASRAGFERSLKWIASKGVDVVRPQQVMDVSFKGKSMISGLEISGAPQGLFKLDHLVWMLTSEESYFLNERIGKYFFPKGALESEWCWVRYRVAFGDCHERDVLPLHALMIEDLESPWVHENMMVVQRTSLPDQFDVWMRIPTVQRFNTEYLTSRGEGMKSFLMKKMSLLNPQIMNFPQEYYYTYAQLGAPRFPVFSAETSKPRGEARYSNLHLDGPEVWPHYSWLAYFEAHQKVNEKILQWWKEKLLREQKEKRKEEAL
jgi:hypothetical protein